jgi:diguanylate cyclase (GGDEF)-like protein/PAS domain S-box-containing protein
LRDSGLLKEEARPQFERFARLASALLQTPTALVSLIDENRQVFLSQHGLSQPWCDRCETPLEFSFCQQLVSSPTPLVIEDTRQDPCWSEHPGTRALHIGAYAGVPLEVRPGLVVGALCVIDPNSRAFSARDLELLADLAESVVSDIQLRQTTQELEHNRAHLNALLQQAPLGVFQLCDRTGTIRSGNPMGARLLGGAPHELPGRHLQDWVDPQDQALLNALEQLWQGDSSGCQLEARFLRDGRDPFWGRLHAALVVGDGHRPIVVALLEDITDYRQALDRLMRQAQELEELSLTDPLTGLSNRRGFLTTGRQLLHVFEREGKTAGVIFVDLNDLKKTNDSLGHDVGDQMIIDCARVLRETFRQADLIARLGGDEFAILAGSMEPSHEAVLRARLEGNLQQARRPDYELVCALGLAYFTPGQGSDLEALIKLADARMYADKKQRKLGRV